MFVPFSDEVDSLLVEPLKLRGDARETVRDRLCQEMVAQGLRNVELADLTGWSTSKVSKITSGKQKLTDADIRIWARALGYTPEPFLIEGYDIRSYKASRYVRSVTDCLDSFFDTGDGDPEYDAIMTYELPLSIMTTLGLRVSDYAVRTCLARSNPDSFADKSQSTVSSVRLWNRATKQQNQVVPELSLWIDYSSDNYAFILYLNKEDTDEDISSLRLQCKDALQKNDTEKEDEEWRKQFFEDAPKWLPKQVIDGEISLYASVTYGGLLADEAMAQLLGEFFKNYCDLVWQINGIDIIPAYFKTGAESALTPYEMYDFMMGNATFKEPVISEVLREHEYKCELDETHKTFIAENGYPYMDVVPIVPFVHGAIYGKSSLSAANAVCLCPNCRAQLTYGRRDDREHMIYEIFRRHKQQMHQAGINISLSELLKLYQL